jgi:hypothetical protein
MLEFILMTLGFVKPDSGVSFITETLMLGVFLYTHLVTCTLMDDPELCMQLLGYVLKDAPTITYPDMFCTAQDLDAFLKRTDHNTILAEQFGIQKDKGK